MRRLQLAAGTPVDPAPAPAPAPGAAGQVPGAAEQSPPAGAEPETTGGGIAEWMSQIGESFAEAWHQAAIDGLDFAIAFIRDSGAVRIDDADGWFVQQWDVMSAMAGWVMLPLVIIAIMQAVAKSDMAQLFKSAVVYPVIALIGAVVAMQIVVLLVAVVDSFSGLFMDAIDANLTQFQGAIRAQVTTDWSIILSIIIFVTLTIVSVATVIIMVVRDAAIYISAVFIPIAFAMLVWPASAKWARRIVEFLIAIIFSKLVMVASISLAVAAFVGANEQFGVVDQSLTLNGSVTSGVAGQPVGEGSGFVGFFLYLMAIAMLMFTVFAPQATFAIVGNLSLDSVARDVAGILDRPSVISWMVLTARMQQFRGNIIKSGGDVDQMPPGYERSALLEQRRIRKNARDRAHNQRGGEEILRSFGYERNPDTDSYEISDTEAQFLRDRGDSALADRLQQMSGVDPATGRYDATNVLFAREALRAERSGARVDYINPGNPGNLTGGRVMRVTTTDSAGQTHTEDRAFINLTDSKGSAVKRVDAQHVRDILGERQASQEAHSVSPTASGSYSVSVVGGLKANNSYIDKAQLDNINHINKVITDHGQADPTGRRYNPLNSHMTKVKT